MVDNEKVLSKIQLIRDNLQQLETIKAVGWEEFRRSSRIWKSNPVAKRDGSGFSPHHPLQVLLVTLGG